MVYWIAFTNNLIWVPIRLLCNWKKNVGVNEILPFNLMGLFTIMTYKNDSLFVWLNGRLGPLICNRYQMVKNVLPHISTSVKIIFSKNGSDVENRHYFHFFIAMARRNEMWTDNYAPYFANYGFYYKYVWMIEPPSTIKGHF